MSENPPQFLFSPQMGNSQNMLYFPPPSYRDLLTDSTRALSSRDTLLNNGSFQEQGINWYDEH